MAKKTQKPPTKVMPRFKGANRRPTFIRQWRKHRHLTLERLAERVEMTTGNLSQIERGEYAYNQDTLEALADALSCQPADLIMRDPTDPAAPWSLWDRLKPEQQRQATRYIRMLIEDSEAA